MADNQTPLMRQYWQIKNQHQDKILLFRMGDFYELFFDDAKIAAPVINVVLTSRNKKSKDETPMCGVPYHSIAAPIGKLLAAGHKVAICDQLEDPEDAKGIVRRGVTRILSPGMVYDPQSLEELSANYLAAFDERTVSFLDASTGESLYFDLHFNVSGDNGLTELLALLRPSEIVLTGEQMKKPPRFDSNLSQPAISLIDMATAEHLTLANELPERFKDAPISARRLLIYAAAMQGKGVWASTRAFEHRILNERMALSPNVLRHLEVFVSYRGNDVGSLFRSVNRTCTSAGARCLKRWLQFPLVVKEHIDRRLNFVEHWFKKPVELKTLRENLRKMGDVERRLAKISYSNCHPRDLISLADSLEVGLAISPLCEGVTKSDLQHVSSILNLVRKQIVEEPPLNLKAGGFIRTGVHHELDELIELNENSQKLLLELETKEKQVTGISSLKIRYNSVFGYYIEVTNNHIDKIPAHYKRKQTLTNAERYVTQELHELESKILSSREKRVVLEEQMFLDLRQAVLHAAPDLINMAQRWSELDVYSSLAWLAIEQKYCRPQIKDSGELKLRSSRHPVVEQEVSQSFVPNDISLKPGECMLLTGPNMAGKSTIMRQVAVTVLLAQTGSFVPAATAELPIYNQLFTRIGASDSLSEGLSTFMVEMKETAELLATAGPDTLVVLDEVGRGTSTYDGMSLAQAILEHLVQKARCVTLFATHYHELTQLAGEHANIRNVHMGIHEKGHEIRFLYTLRSGPANKSYGLHVARLAGVPESIVRRAQALLAKHESQAQVEHQRKSSDLPLLQFAEEQGEGGATSGEYRGDYRSKSWGQNLS